MKKPGGADGLARWAPWLTFPRGPWSWPAGSSGTVRHDMYDVMCYPFGFAFPRIWGRGVCALGDRPAALFFSVGLVYVLNIRD